MHFDEPARILLKRMREEAGMTVRALAEEIGRPVSTYSSYEDKFKRRFLPLDLVRDLEGPLSARGISINRVRALAGIAEDEGREIGSEENSTAAFSELDIRGSAGSGAMGGDGSSSGHVVHVWRLPRDLVKSVTHAAPEKIKIITVVGDSMEGTFRPYEKVMVDTSDIVPSPPGIFVVFDGLGLVVKRVEHVAHSEPPRVRITSDNPHYSAYERALDEALIQGRVLGRWQWV